MRTKYRVTIAAAPSALLHLAAQPMQVMVPPLVRGCWDLASEPLSAVPLHRKRCTSRRRRRSITRRHHPFTSRRLFTSLPSTLARVLRASVSRSSTLATSNRSSVLDEKPGPLLRGPGISANGR